MNSSIEKLLDEKRIAKESEKKVVGPNSFSTFFKKQDPPKFKGDCLDYLEFKKKWASQVTSHNPPVELRSTYSKEICLKKEKRNFMR